MDFGYTTAYSLLNIDETIERYAPRNRHKPNFQHTDRNEHIRLFSQINNAVLNNGNGLHDIEYFNPAGQRLGTLLHKQEVNHLQDVSTLIQRWHWFGALPTLLLITCIGWAWRKNIPPPSLLSWTLGVISWPMIIGVVLGLLGPTTVFYTLHEWIFPPDHPWFFYYEDSLMTTLMKAPDLFGWIACVWLISACTLCGFIGVAWQQLWALNKRKR